MFLSMFAKKARTVTRRHPEIEVFEGRRLLSSLAAPQATESQTNIPIVVNPMPVASLEAIKHGWHVSS